MSTIITFPLGRVRGRQHNSTPQACKGRKADPPGPRIIILPVIRIERHGETPPVHGAGEVICGHFHRPPEPPPMPA